jgi:uncharacterized damage-inducible protein DinB
VEIVAEGPAAEVTVLLSYLTAQRRHVLDILDGLDEESLRRPVLPSGWSCAGLVRHLALDVERFWFRAVVAGERAVIDELPAEANKRAWHVGPEVPVGSVLDQYRQEIVLADAIIAARAPDSALAWWPRDLFGDFRLDNLREILLHVITETACHAGHLDAARELIDGRQWLVLDG